MFRSTYMCESTFSTISGAPTESGAHGLNKRPFLQFKYKVVGAIFTKGKP